MGRKWVARPSAYAGSAVYMFKIYLVKKIRDKIAGTKGLLNLLVKEMKQEPGWKLKLGIHIRNKTLFC